MLGQSTELNVHQSVLVVNLYPLNVPAPRYNITIKCNPVFVRIYVAV